MREWLRGAMGAALRSTLAKAGKAPAVRVGRKRAER
jgi:hypothetical protein